MRYRLGATVDLRYVPEVLTAIGAAGERAQLDPEITLSLMLATEVGDGEQQAEFIHSMHPPAPRKGPVPRHGKRKNGGEWPAEGSIYSVVLAALKDEAKSPQELREALQAGGFAIGSLNSALVRLEKASKIKKSHTGAWMAA